ncbi:MULTISPECIES: hypothetical protein [unclassified Nitratiruptor]|uniref:hypothetical protein n=1 Tax=unclassified Nitratiruptor TaxID=2624044 RepID=UPI0019166698|nr:MULTISPECIES: hypothetical protein [unclassified Nitratiruptor]BCD59987.1 hypothetical protein NitYY0810_C0750 [Nitratiruptor sp. YY08-10]BCD63910.1 hypothetical protein NitYY0814_C0749 [Nitratiruptor sp. YY08-14]
MKKIIALMLLTLSLFASGKFLSPLPLPKTYFIDLDINRCDDYCLQSLLNNGEIFSFLAKAKESNDPDIQKEYKKYALLFHMSQKRSIGAYNILIALQKRLAPFGNSINKSLLAYFLKNGFDFDVTTKLFQNSDTLITYINETNTSYDLIIVPLPYAQKDIIARLQTNTPIFIPTIHRSMVESENENIFFGGPDYYTQLDTLLSFIDENLSIFYLDKSPLSKELTDFAILYASVNSKLYPIDEKIQNMKQILYENEDLNESSVLFNTPLVKTALALSQMTYYDIEPKIKISTQINYNPRLFSLTQPKDRENLYIAISFAPIQPTLEAYNALIDSNINYDWLGYACFAGIEALTNTQEGMKSDFQILDNQILYPIRILQTTKYRFIDQTLQENNLEF